MSCTTAFIKHGCVIFNGINVKDILIALFKNQINYFYV